MVYPRGPVGGWNSGGGLRFLSNAGGSPCPIQSAPAPRGPAAAVGPGSTAGRLGPRPGRTLGPLNLRSLPALWLVSGGELPTRLCVNP
jgi:hypothetical protein